MIVAGQEPSATPPAADSQPSLRSDIKVVDDWVELAPTPRICVPPPLLKVVETSQSANTAEAIRNALVSFMNGPTVEVIPIESRIMVHIETEARMKSCNQVLYSTLTLQKSGGTARIGSTLKKVAPMAGLISLVGTQPASVTATVARVAAEVVGEMTVDRKKKDRVTYEYKLVPVGTDIPIVAEVQKYRSEEDSEDLISPLLAKNAEVLIIAALRHHNLELARRKQIKRSTSKEADVQTAQIETGEQQAGQNQ
jgi:hypothetical protein